LLVLLWEAPCAIMGIALLGLAIMGISLFNRTGPN
jgi:hypothetical protein